ncbi:MAG: FAD-dependent oxidoreductase, partial [Patescibacteria group bacterium]
MYDIIIIGGGPAGVAAGIYTARKKLKTLLMTEEFGGQSIVSDDIQNWIGDAHISGFDLAKKLEAHLRSYSEDVDIKIPEKAVEVKRIDNNSLSAGFEVKTDKNNVYQARAVILASGARRRKLNIPGEDRLNGKGVSYCSTCDAPLFKDKTVAVVGGGNAGLEAAIDLFPYATKIYVLEFGEAFKGDPISQEEVKKNPKTEIIFYADAKEVMGDNFVSGLKYVHRKTGEEKILDVNGVFVEIGSVPNSEMVKGLVALDKYGQVIIDSKH